ncbi:proline--tRNA ligase [Fictibacillus phosphorivorans]|uniref:proline--tRNA ligase n=1 Tax=Fictibacillus phosphorivorans TaxID=1221500 RepID=UPI00203BD2CE|nr:proline--tRNA ligase [Fictibacillus phosphorivorans]MCM3717124.1 proline--tRNA ligase [Fictibacillus phosphorivorans]MCM3774811.1 proline--tRNA ligase [Fictibacillus phosphorivorans]
MRQSQLFMPTLREVPADADIKSHQLLLRAGFIRQNAAGIYSFLPLGKKVLHKIENIVREEMNRAGAQEMMMPALQLAELWQESGRWYSYGPELMRLKDRHDRDFALGATHEEVITSIIRDEVKSYKKLPLNLYQIQTKFRDEKRPRFGLLRGREFIMKDAYSFHDKQESLDETYEVMKDAYSSIFSRCGLNFRAVLADSGAIGGKDNHEFMVLSEIGEDLIAYSTESDFAANIEMAPVVMNEEASTEELLDLEKVETQEAKNIEDVSKFLKVASSKIIKSLLYLADGEPVLVLVRGDHEVNEIKLKNELSASEVVMASEEDAVKWLNTKPGSIGPVAVSDVKVVADQAVPLMVNAVCGANEEGYHFIHVNVDRDCKIDQTADLRFVVEGDLSPDGKGKIVFAKGIEVGHVFKLGKVYSEPMNASYLDENGKNQIMSMGCYGIGVSRTLAAVAEENNDERGLIWPLSLTPFDIHLIAVNSKNAEQTALSDKLYEQLKGEGYDCLYDDRPERAGVKFADSDLIGLPIRIMVGKKAAEDIVEVKIRKSGETYEVPVSELKSVLQREWEKLV